MTTPAPLEICWPAADGQATHHALWRSEAGWPAPAKVVLADDRLAADTAYRLVCEGTALLWQGDYHQARQLVQALARRIDRKPPKPGAVTPTPALLFHQHRQRQGHRARLLSMVLVPVDAQQRVPLRRAPDVQAACREAWGPGAPACVMSLRELLGLIGAHEWRKAGVPIPVLKGHIEPHYGVFSPVRGEYIDLLVKAALPKPHTQALLQAGEGPVAFDIGVGTGVLSAVLARRGVARIVATDLDDRALACARGNLERLGVLPHVTLQQADLFPPGRAALVVCNPPWVPAKPGSALENAVYDPDSRMLRGFLAGLNAHLLEAGEGWLILSDLAEHLGLRTRDELLGWIEAAGLSVLGRLEAKPLHRKAQDASDPLHSARSAETTSLWRLGTAQRTNS